LRKVRDVWRLLRPEIAGVVKDEGLRAFNQIDALLSLKRMKATVPAETTPSGPSPDLPTQIPPKVGTGSSKEEPEPVRAQTKIDEDAVIVMFASPQDYIKTGLKLFNHGFRYDKLLRQWRSRIEDMAERQKTHAEVVDLMRKAGVVVSAAT
jgi:hypothetical protein